MRNTHSLSNLCNANSIQKISVRNESQICVERRKKKGREMTKKKEASGSNLPPRPKAKANVRPPGQVLSSHDLKKVCFVCPRNLLRRWGYLESIPASWGEGGTKKGLVGDRCTCKRCKQTFTLLIPSLTTNEKVCHYHWLGPKPTNERNPYNGKATHRYECCGGVQNSAPCTWAASHVVGNVRYPSDSDLRMLHDLCPYTSTWELIPAKNKPNKQGVHDVLALDAEFWHTTKGQQAALLAVVDVHGSEILVCVIKPGAPVLDVNTKCVLTFLEPQA